MGKKDINQWSRKTAINRWILFPAGKVAEHLKRHVRMRCVREREFSMSDKNDREWRRHNVERWRCATEERRNYFSRISTYPSGPTTRTRMPVRRIEEAPGTLSTAAKPTSRA